MSAPYFNVYLLNPRLIAYLILAFECQTTHLEKPAVNPYRVPKHCVKHENVLNIIWYLKAKWRKSIN